MELNKKSIFQIIKTDNFFNSCGDENKEIIELINELKINNNYEYPKTIVIHNIISKIFITRNKKYLIIIEDIIDKLIENKDQIIDVKHSLMFIMKKINLYKKINITDKNQYKNLEDKINNFLNLKNVKLDKEKNNNLTSSEDENYKKTSNLFTFIPSKISSLKDSLTSIYQTKNGVKHTSSFSNYFKKSTEKSTEKRKNQRIKESNKKNGYFKRLFTSIGLKSIGEQKETSNKETNNGKINSVYRPVLSKGLVNCGNSCFMSACIQLLFSCDDFRNFLIDTNLNNFNKIYNKPNNIIKLRIPNKEKENHKKNSKIIFEMIKNIFIKLNEEKSLTEIKYPNTYKKLYKIIFPEEYTNNIPLKQQDAIIFLQEVLVYTRINVFNFTLIQKQSNSILNENINQILILNEFDKNEKKIEPSTLQNIININTKFNNTQNSVIINDDINKYIIIQLNRGSNNYSSETNKEIVIDNEININNKKYFLIGSIIKIGDQKSGHYIYVTFDSNGNIYKIYDDDKIYDKDNYAINKTNNSKIKNNKPTIDSLLSTSSVIFLFKKFDNIKS